MKKWFAFLLALLLSFPFTASAGINPFLEVPVQMTVSADTPDQMVSFTGIDFGEGASLIRFKAATDDELIIRVFADDMGGNPIATAVFHALTKEYRYTVSLAGVHDLYFKLEGSGLFASWQAFTSKSEIEEAIRSERSEAYEDTLPSDYTRACANGGTIEKFTYEAHDVFNDGAVYEKTAFVYLPYGYDAAQTYDLLILCHGIGGNEYEWGMTGPDSKVKRVMDNLIDRGEIKPFIVVTPNGRAGKTEDHSSFYRFDEELRNDLLPALAERYAVDIYDRNRCAMAGLSMGGMQTVNLGIGKCLDIFSAFGAFSACPTTNTASVTAAALNASGDLPIRVFYSICGTEDGIALSSAKAAVEGLDALTDRLNEKNFILQYVPGGHDFGVWYLGFYNFARMIGGEQD
ncbi:MAG: hypothetical protein IKH57_12625 [Clostridia bacterium]|nr:hypothetical protein [Clostridia bacterium]